MKMKTCENGHIYDEDLYPDGCPYCNPSRIVRSYDENRGTTDSTSAAGSDDKTTMRPVSSLDSSEDDGRTKAPSSHRGDDGFTVAPRANNGGGSGNPTVVIHHDGLSSPVTGWLVCIDGPRNLKGKSFEVCDKINTVGRDWSNDIRLDDPTITAVDHARIAYDPKHREFALLPEKNTNMIYLNDHAIYSPTPLSSYDVIELGESKFLFVAFCGPRFGWDTGLQAEE